ncbi:MAG: NADPH:quinone reductase-like Zn-dependent oxidoreductase [Halioglobus sp.]|jgi:NADPH:quinone reductase-like Zn-dependent oxidoreductase
MTTDDRFCIRDGDHTMWAVLTTGNGAYDKLLYCEVPMPKPDHGEVLLQVLAAGINNTEINTRVGWYSSTVTTGTEGGVSAQQEETSDKADGGWNEATPFPFIQGTDCCGRVVDLGAGVDSGLISRRVLVRSCMRTNGFSSLENKWMASDFDGAFAQFVVVPADEVFPIECDWSDEELATLPCAYGTAENMLHRAGIGSGDRVLVTGASGGVGSAVVQLAKRRGATIVGVAAEFKHPQILNLGAQQMLTRDADPVSALGENSIDAVFDNVGGEGFSRLLDVLRRGGKYVSSGAIGGPLVTLDMRTFYLKDLSLMGCTAWDEPIFPNLISYVEHGEIVPVLARTFALKDIAHAQQEFLKKDHVGNFVLVPPVPEPKSSAY